MNTKSKFLCVIVALCSMPFTILAGGNTAMDAFISRIKATNTLVTVGNIWAPDKNFDKTKLYEYVADAQPLNIDYTSIAAFMKQKNQAISLVIPALGGDIYTLELGRYDFLTNDFEVHAKGENNSDKLVDYTPGLYYRGVVKGIPGSVAAFSFFNNEVYGIFSIPDVGNFVVAPNSMVGKDYDYNPSYLLYNDAQLKIKGEGPGCSTDLLPEQYGNEMGAKTTTFPNNKIYNNCNEVRVYEVADYDTYVKKGSSVTNATNFMTALFNNQSTVYKNEGVPIVLKYIQVNTASDVYMTITSALSIRFLRKFGWATKNVMHGCDIALLMSTRFGGMGGVAWLKSLCRTYSSSDSSGPYGFANISNSSAVNFPTYSWNLMVMCHEMGHMVGSPHTHRCCWNPPGTGTTAIDGCQTLEGSCPMPSPMYPSGGGTVMSYCHLQSIGINLTKGFGQQPGDTIRYYIRSKFSSTCEAKYLLSTALSKANRALSANIECTDISGGDTTTYYWYDRYTADRTDDTLVLKVKKHGNYIGNLDSVGFSVVTGTGPLYGSGTADTVSLPSGTPGTSTFKNYAMRRYWKITPTAAPVTPVTVMFPFTGADTTDVNGSAPGATAPVANFKMYIVNTPTNPDPLKDSVQFAPVSSMSIYDKGATATTSTWSLSNIGTTLFASVKVAELSGGGTLYYQSGLSSVHDINSPNSWLRIYPNPASTAWHVTIDGLIGNDKVIEFKLYASDGRLVHMQSINAGVVNEVDASKLASGVYCYRIVSGTDVFTGTLSKQ